MSNNEITLDLLKELDQLRSDIVLFELNKKQNEKAIESLRSKIKDKETLIELEKNRVSEFQNDFCNSKNYTEKELLKGRSEEEQFYLKDLLTLFAEKKRLLDEKQPFEEIKNTKIQEEREKAKDLIKQLPAPKQKEEKNSRFEFSGWTIILGILLPIVFAIIVTLQIDFKSSIIVGLIILLIALGLYGFATLNIIIGIKYYKANEYNEKCDSLKRDYDNQLKIINQECEDKIKLIEKEFNSRKDY